jgi:hypothetical protein
MKKILLLIISFGLSVFSVLQSQNRLLPPDLQNKYDLQFYYIDLNVDNIDATLQGNVMFRIKSVVDVLDTISFSLHSGYVVEKILVNDVEVAWLSVGHEKLIPNQNILNGETAEVKVFYNGVAGSSGGSLFGGIQNKVDNEHNNTRVTWTLSEPSNAYEWLPCKQVLTDKIDSAGCF